VIHVVEPWALVILAIAGAAIAIVTSMVGLAGAMLFIPLMILGFGIPAEVAIGCSLVASTASTTSATIQYIRQKKVNFRIGLLFNIVDVPGVLAGTWLATQFDSTRLAGICGFAIIALAVFLLANKTGTAGKVAGILVPGDDACAVPGSLPAPGPANDGGSAGARGFAISFTRKFITQCTISSFFGGFITGFAGLGGGTVDTCSMLIIGIPMHVAVGSSVFAMAMTYWFSVFTRSIYTGIDWVIAIVLAIGAGVGATIGARYQSKFKISLLKKVMCSIAIFAGVELVLMLFGVAIIP
jgi:uncharacterized membrane protein YfcA